MAPDRTVFSKQKIAQTLKAFQSGNFAMNATEFLGSLGYKSDKTHELQPNSARGLLEFANRPDFLNSNKAYPEEWKTVDFLFQLTDDEVRNHGQTSLEFDSTIDVRSDKHIESYIFFAVQLKKHTYNRTELANITREINRLFPMPALVLFKHGETMTLSIINRHIHKRDVARDVLEKVTLIKDINITNPHRGHIEILYDLALPQIIATHDVTNFVQLDEAWRKTLDTSVLNKRFYRELANWYFWALQHVDFPKQTGVAEQVNRATNVIRLITRLIFVWFLKERELVPEALFDRESLGNLVKDLSPDNSTFYKAILQNLFFATLNTPMNDPNAPRMFRSETNGKGRNDQYMVHNQYRYQKLFSDPENALQIFASIPFLNGGLFECLDKREDVDGKLVEIRIDGFSDVQTKQPTVPNKLFFGEEEQIDLNETYGTRGRRYSVRGLIDTLNRYKFTIAENTPIEEEVALDPELLGKVFENLLASYNPETGATARKQTGSFYTPREIVNYMVDESLITHLEMQLKSEKEDGDNLNERLRHLFAYTDDPHQFSPAEIDKLIAAIDAVKILDPACGSGAFPMGILQRLVFILSKLDPNNAKWKQRQIERVCEAMRAAEKIDDHKFRENTLNDLKAQIANIEEAFTRNELDYGRKLFLIENCIYGVDIQPIAIQIAKLRFFISLIIDQGIRPEAENLGIRALPNLETKFVAANALLTVDKPAQSMLQNEELRRAIQDKERELKIIRQRHFTARTTKTKEKYRREDALLRGELGKLLEKEHWPADTTAKLVRWDPYDQNASGAFFDPEWMFGIVSGFDIVIGNPPYIKEYTYRQAFDGIRKSPYYQGKMDIWYLFACKSIDYLKPDTGLLCFIATNNWITSAGASSLRNKIVADSRILQLIDFGEYKIFENSGIQTMILLVVKDLARAKYRFDLRQLKNVRATFDDILSILQKSPAKAATYLTPTFERKSLVNKPLVFSSAATDEIIKKIEAVSNFFLTEKEIAVGIDVHQDFVNKAAVEVLGNQFKVGDGIFIISDSELTSLNLTDSEKELVRPYYTTSELGKYYANPVNHYWVIYTDSSFKNASRMKPYPNLKRHLDHFRKIITSDNYPYGLHRSRDERFFKSEKVVSLRKCVEPTFSYVNFDCYVSQTFNVIATERVDLKYLTGLLNSRLVEFWLRHRGKMQGKLLQIDKEPLMRIPLLVPTRELQDPIVRIIEAILEAKREHGVEIRKLGLEIDSLVYKLYELTDEEIAILENSVPTSIGYRKTQSPGKYE